MNQDLGVEQKTRGGTGGQAEGHLHGDVETSLNYKYK